MSGSITATAATRDPTQTPFASDSVFNLPLGSGAQWGSNAQLSGAGVFVNTTASGFTENVYSSTASDPVVTVSNTGASGGSASTYQVHIPAAAVAASGTDNTFTVDDTTSGTWYSFGGFNRTGQDTATVSQGSAEPDTGSGLTQSGSNFDQGVGTLRQSDLSAGTINHMLRIEIPTSLAASYSDSVSSLAPYAWPQTQEDGFAVNGNGGVPYSGTIPFGVTIGIPAGTAEPAAVAANPGADMLWKALQDHGAMIRDTTSGSGNTIVIQADQTVNSNDPLIQGMDQFGSQIMAAAQILTNQGPNSVNGGGTPIVPLDPPVGGAAATSTVASATPLPSATSSDTATITPAALSSGPASPGSSSALTFAAPATSSSGTAAGTSATMSDSSGPTDTTSATDAASTLTQAAAASTTDLTPPTPSASSASWWHDSSGTSGGHGSWWANHEPQVAAVAPQQS